MEIVTKEDPLYDPTRDAKLKFLEGYEERMGSWKDLAMFMENELKLLTTENPPVNAVFSHRIKDKRSLKGKIEKQQKMGACLSLETIQASQWDIIGTRICLYFPCQIDQVRSFLEKHKLFEILPHRPHQLGKPFREHEHRPSDQENRPYEERMGFYEADHYWIRLWKHLVQDQLPSYNGEVVEIQVRTVLMDAWAEVRHDLDYKHIIGFPGEDELRVLDAIKGSISACEIMQNQLFMLGEQRVKEDNVPFTKYGDRAYFWRAVNNALKPRHKVLLRQFGEEPLSSNATLLQQNIFKAADINTPLELKKRAAELVTAQAQTPSPFLLVPTMDLVQRLLETVDRVVERTRNKKKIILEPFLSASVSSFLAVYLFSNMTVAGKSDVIHRLGGSHFNDRVKGVGHLNHGSYCRNMQSCVYRWYQILCIVLDTLQFEFSQSSQYDERARYQTLSTVWHIHEWVSAHLNDRNPEKLADVITHFLHHFQRSSIASSDGTVLWSISAAVYVQNHYRNYWIDDISVYSDDWVRHKHDAIMQETFDSEYWLKGEQVAVDIIGIDLMELRHASLYRAMCEYPCNEEYVEYRLRSKPLDLKYQIGLGHSFLGAASAFATADICNSIMAQPNVPVNLRGSDGLSLIHIAVNGGNVDMVRHLTLEPDLDTGVVWYAGNILPLDPLVRNDICGWMRMSTHERLFIVDKNGDYVGPRELIVTPWTALDMAERLVTERRYSGIESELKRAGREECLELLRERVAKDAGRAVEE